MTATRPFGEAWPADESQVVIDAIRSVVSTVSDPTSRPASERLLSEAGRRWADAHRSGTVMRARLEALGELLATEEEPARSDYLAALRLVTDAATWTSLDHLEREALVDPLTGAGNRRALERTLEGAAGAALRLGFGLVVVAIDLDGLKRINDGSGHRAGDRALVALVDALAGSVRASDAVFRTGGDEFVLVLQGTSLTETEPLLRRIAAGGAPSFSWGAAALAPDLRSAEELVAAADDDLYRRRRAARRSGPVVSGPDAGGATTDAGGTSPAVVAVAGAAPAVDHPVLVRLAARRRPQPHPRPERRRTLVAAAAAVALVGGVAAVVAGLASPPHARSASPPSATGPGGAVTPTAAAGPPTTPSSATTMPAAGPGPAAGPAAVTPGGSGVPVGSAVMVAPTGAVQATATAAPGGVPASPAASSTGVPVGGAPVTTGSPAPVATPAASPSVPSSTVPATSTLGTTVSGLVGTVDGVAGTVGEVIDGVLGVVTGIAPTS